jgi:hypothetical protein
MMMIEAFTGLATLIFVPCLTANSDVLISVLYSTQQDAQQVIGCLVSETLVTVTEIAYCFGI